MSETDCKQIAVDYAPSCFSRITRDFDRRASSQRPHDGIEVFLVQYCPHRRYSCGLRLKGVSSITMSDTDPGPSSSNGECTSVYPNALCSNAAERAPLMDTAEEELGQSTLSDCINKVAQEPLTPLTKILLILALILLLVSSASV